MSGQTGRIMYAVVLFHISFIPDRSTNLSYVPTFKKVGTVGGDPPQRSEFEAAHCRKGRNSQRRPAANRNKPKYRLSPTVPLILAMSQPLKRSEFEAAHCRLFASFCHEESDFLFVYADHSFTEILRQLCDHLSVRVVCNGLYDSGGSLCGVARLEDTASYEYALSAELHHQSGIGRSCNTACGEVYNGELAVFRNVLYKLIVDLKILCRLVKLVL